MMTCILIEPCEFWDIKRIGPQTEKKKCNMKGKVAQLCPTLCSPMDYRVHGILQARILEWVPIPFSRALLMTSLICRI